MPETDHARFTVILTDILDLKSEAGEDDGCVFEIEASFIKRLLSLGRVITNTHELL